MFASASYEKLSEYISVCITPEHRFGTDAFLLASFASPRKKDTVCDLGTGCGIIPLLMLRDCSPRLTYAVDIQQQAIEQLKDSLRISGLEGKIIPRLADLKELDSLPAGAFDVVTCNPPYKAGGAGILSELAAEQIARHEVLCTMEDVCNAAARLLKYGGRLCLCQRPERLADVISAMRAADIEPKRLRFVAKTPSSAPWLFLLEGKKGSKPFMQVEPVLSVYDGDEFSAEMSRIYGWGKPGN
ncbi:tRNA1(Val) (adenine(37)-N6)-methyltransferase [Massiliimalia massiliensis]|uniref:tRNA1(Val) (adenine(37)-N6)-methyltransferase n=1 Tax=Massiliimalia massiliensis TaxID=1852384 RepID=UPI0009850054|nr:methyltransferase [Massiliimalia massiliensis]